MNDAQLTPEQWRQAWKIFQSAQSIPEPDLDSYISSLTSDPLVLARIAALFEELNHPEPEDELPVEARQPGQQIGRYRIDSQIGHGSFGEVWSGQDTQLGRPVALKFIAPDRVGSRSNTRRFLREARAASSLNHPHIVVVHELLESDSGPVIVMERVDGTSLRSLLHQPLPQRKAFHIGSQILSAIAFAHQAGVVHRDLKPENIMVRTDGFVKVLDFGLASQVISTSVGETATAGLSVGTLRYMAPEQCNGQPATGASDIFALGVILHEMLGGQHPFEAPSWIDTVHAIVNREAKPLPGPTGALIARMLGKSPSSRPSAAEVLALLQSVDQPDNRPLLTPRLWKQLAVAAATACVAWLGFQYGPWERPSSARLTDTRLDMGPGMAIEDRGIALSPNGRYLVFHGGKGKSALQFFDFTKGTTTELKGFEGNHAFWSPDGSELAYTASGKLWRKPFPSGPAREICEAPALSAAHWGPNGIILFASSSTLPIQRVPQDGGTPTLVTHFDPGVKRHEAPTLLPDGRHFVYWSSANRFSGQLILADLDGKDASKVLAETSSSAIFLPQPGSSQGALVYRARGAIMLLPFNASSNEVAGPARQITERASRGRHQNVPATASAQGDLVYRDMQDLRSQVKIFSRDGKLLAKVGDLKEYIAAKPSPDFRRLAILSENHQTEQKDFAVLDLETGKTTPIPAARAASDPVWSPDGRRLLAGNSSVSGGADPYLIDLPPSSPPIPKLQPGPGISSWPSDWSAAAKAALMVVSDQRTGFDIWALPMDGNAKPHPVIATPAREQRASLSPDGKLLLYMSDESGAPEIYVTPYPPDGRKWKISTGGGAQPNWRGDGKEIFYRSNDFAIFSAAVGGLPGQPSFARPELLFGGVNADPALMVVHAEPSKDGQRFAVITGNMLQAVTPLRLRLNWWAESK